MDKTTTALLVGGLVVAWILGPAAIAIYRLIVVPRRYQLIRGRFMSDNLGTKLAPDDPRSRSGAWHYARLLDPAVADPKNPEKDLERQFFYFHGWNRYWFPLLSIVILSGLMIVFSGIWVADRLASDVQTAPREPGVTPTAGSSDSPRTLSKDAARGRSVSVSAAEAQPPLTPLRRIPPPFVMALWGAYVWSLYEILSRARSGDLTPIELYDIASRYVVAIPVGYAFSLLVFETVPALAAFAVSAFPLRDIRQLFRKQALQRLKENTQSTANLASKGYINESLFGMGDEAITRLQELDIETFLDLAYADPVKLMIRTGAPIELVLSWIDQALLSVYAFPHKEALALYGMPCALDMCEFYARHCYDVGKRSPKPWPADPAVQALAAKLNVPADFIVDQTLRSVFEDQHTQFLIRVWYGPATAESDL